MSSKSQFNGLQYYFKQRKATKKVIQIILFLLCFFVLSETEKIRKLV
jgi:hypothetical protein